MIIGSRHNLNAEIARQTRLSQAVARIQTEISEGKKILAPSDDPVGAARVTQIGQAQANEKVWAANADGAAALAGRVETALTSIGSAVDRAVELITLARSSTASAEDRQNYAGEIAGLAADIAELSAQSDSRGQSFFSNGAPLAIPVGKTSTLAANPSYESVFGPAGNDLLATLNAAVTALQSGSDAAIASSMTAVQGAQGRLTDARGEHGSRAALIDQVRERFLASGLALKSERSDIEDTDVTEATPRMNAAILTLEAAQASFVRINRQTLFDLLG